MDLLAGAPAFDLFAPDWPIRHRGGQYPPTLMRTAGAQHAEAHDSIVSPGCIITGGKVRRSILSPDVHVGPDARVESSILLPGVRIGAGARLQNVIVDENVVVPAGTAIGTTNGDRRRFTVTPGGVAVVAEGTLLG
jgi:glucose-1-phosphate adenylyltransferase